MYNTIKQLIAIVCKLYFLTVILISELWKFFLYPPPHNYKEMILIFQLKKYHCLHKRSPVLLRKFKTAMNSVKKIEICFNILSLSFVQVRKSHETQENTWMVVLNKSCFLWVDSMCLIWLQNYSHEMGILRLMWILSRQYNTK